MNFKLLSKIFRLLSWLYLVKIIFFGITLVLFALNVSDLSKIVIEKIGNNTPQMKLLVDSLREINIIDLVELWCLPACLSPVLFYFILRTLKNVCSYWEKSIFIAPVLIGFYHRLAVLFLFVFSLEIIEVILGYILIDDAKEKQIVGILKNHSEASLDFFLYFSKVIYGNLNNVFDLPVSSGLTSVILALVFYSLGTLCKESPNNFQ